MINELPVNVSIEIEEPEETEVPSRRTGRANKGKPPEGLIEVIPKITTLES